MIGIEKHWIESIIQFAKTLYNKCAIQAAAQRLTGGSVTALLNAAVADYLPHALGDALPEELAAGQDGDATP